MKRIVFVITLAAIVWISQVNSLACFVVSPDFPKAYDRARAVFIGEVKEIKKPVSLNPTAPLADRLYRIVFKVEYSWKGAGFQEFGAPELVVLSDQGIDGSCFDWGSFSEGRKYLVYAEETVEKDLIVSLGNRTALLFKSSEDLKELQRISNPFYRFRVKPSAS